MKKEGNGVVLRGRESNSAIHVIVIIIWPSRTLEIAKCLVILSVATLEKKKIAINVGIPTFSVLST